MLKDIRLLIDKINNRYRQTRILKRIIKSLSCITIFITIYLLIKPAFTLENSKSYTLTLIDSYDYTWKEEKITSYNLNLYFMDTKGNYIEGKDITIDIGPNNLKDDPYGFGYMPINGETTRGQNILEILNLMDYSLITGEKYTFDHAEVYVNNNWQSFTSTSNHWDIWCQYASSKDVKDDYGFRGKYGNNIAYTVTEDTEYKLVYKKVRNGIDESIKSLGAESGITFGMFNYSGTNEEIGINNNGIYNYFSFRDSTLETPTYINKETDADGFTENRAKVLPKLESGYPVFNCKGLCINPSLGYLFGKDTNPIGNYPEGVISYTPSNTLLQKEIVDNVEYYYYDSNRNAVDYDTENNYFMLRNYTERGYQLSSYPKEINRYEFLPFNYWNENRTISKKDESDFTYNYEKEEVDHWFGMTMEFDFYMPKDGKINNSDMIFSFSGDDDVWVFIDDVLVLDLGGTHGAVDGDINFSTGEVTSYLNWNGVIGTPNKTSILKSFEEASSTSEITWNKSNTTFENYTKHTLKFFYLERGAAISNCKIRFNIPVLPSGSLLVQKLFDGIDNYDDNHEFTLYDVTNSSPAVNTKYRVNNIEYYTDNEGKFSLKTGEVAVFTLTNYHTYFVEETNPGLHSISKNCTLDNINCIAINKTNDFTINPDSSYEAVFTNKVKTYNLNISKIAYNSSQEDLFKFKIDLYNGNNEKIDIPVNIISSNEYEIDNVEKTLQFNLKNEENITINDIPINSKVYLEEISHNGYTVVMKSGDVTLSENEYYEFIMDGDKNIIIYNIPGVILPETGGIGILPYIIIGIIIIIFTSFIILYNYTFKLKEGGY